MTDDKMMCPHCKETFTIDDIDEWGLCDYEWISAADLIARWTVKCPLCKTDIDMTEVMALKEFKIDEA